jgi:hypothetical protein
MIAARRDFKYYVRKCKLDYDIERTEQLRKALENDLRLYWRLLKATKTKPIQPNISTAELYNHFLSLHGESNDETIDDEITAYVHGYDNDIENEYVDIFYELNNEITYEEILNAIGQLKTGKSGGDDMLLNELFIYGKQVLLSSLHKIFNHILNVGCFPETWTDGLIIPLHKKGDINVATNYHGITLLSTFSKLFTRVINNRLSKWADSNGFIIEAQAGFRKTYSTADNIFVLHTLISHVVNNRRKLFCAFIDFRRSYDCINHRCLWYFLRFVSMILNMNL